MKKSTRNWLIAAGALVLIGVLIFVGVSAAFGFDFMKLSAESSVSRVTNTYEFDEDFENISIHVETAAVRFAPSEDGMCRVVCEEEEERKHTVIVQEGTLVITEDRSHKWFQVSINFQSPKVTVYLPKDTYASLCVDTTTGDIKVPEGFRFETVKVTGTTSGITCYAAVSQSVELKTTTGDITLGNLEAETIRLTSTTGDITVNNASCDNLTAKSSTGRIKLKDTVAREKIQAENTTGGVRFERCDAWEIGVKTTTGDVKGTLRSEKIFITKTSTGDIRVPSSTSGGKCEIKTSTGDIQIEIE